MLNINFTSPNLVLLIHHKFEGGIGYVLAFSIIIFLQEFFIYFLHIYIQIFGPKINTNAIHNRSN
jgi:hypothetical protein